MRHNVLRERPDSDAFTDLLFNALLGFAFMFVVAFTLISDPADNGNVMVRAEVLVTVQWPDSHPDDVDLVAEDPRGNVVWYHNKDTGLMHLDRDDRGVLQDRLVVDGQEVFNPINQETVSVRRLAPGEYVVNVLHYQSNFNQPLPVTVKVEKLNPEVTVVYYGTHELEGAGHELTAVRFSVDRDGQIYGVNRHVKPLLVRARK